ncbi:MAG: hypothetical protein AB1403_17320, partial [Candidatus Riflebacteria bacterium]
ELQRLFDEVELAIDMLKKNPALAGSLSSIWHELRDIHSTFSTLEQGQILDETEIFEIKTLALHLSHLHQLYQKSGLRLPDHDFADLQGLIKLLNPGEIVVSSFYIYEDYDPELAKIRENKRLIEKQIFEVEEGRRQALKAERTEIVTHERQQEFKVRQSLSGQLQSWLAPLRHDVGWSARLEMVIAKAVQSQKWSMCRPEIIDGEDGVLIVEDAINPEVAQILKTSGKAFCPVSIELQRNVTVLTGANMGGKTVAMQTVAFNLQLARLGFFTPAQSVCLPMLDYICFIGGDFQDQNAGLSSFGAEIIRLTEVASLVKQGCGVALFDEFARSTNPSEGCRFVQALCEFLQRERCYGLIATHYDGIAPAGASFYQVVGLKKNADEAEPQLETAPGKILDRLCNSMDYRLQKVSGERPVPHDALRIAGLLAVDKDFLAILKKFYD